jgi:histidinol dehydrogenase
MIQAELKMRKICGPGNQLVTAAKILEVSLLGRDGDRQAGLSIAAASSDPAFFFRR